MSFLSSIGDFFKKLWDAIRKVLAIILLIIAVVLIVWSAIVTGGATLVLFGFTLSTSMAALVGILCFTGAFLVDSETAGEVVGKVGEAIGDAAASVAGAVVDVSTSALGAFLSSPAGIAILALGGYWVYKEFFKDDDSASKA